MWHRKNSDPHQLLNEAREPIAIFQRNIVARSEIHFVFISTPVQMARFSLFTALLALFLSPALAIHLPGFEKRQNIQPGTPLYNCHEACGKPSTHGITERLNLIIQAR